jgi:hypothetical protein
VFVGWGGVACGPSFQAVYEGESHFEHCYALDQKAVPDDAKKECWRDWLRGYTYGQSNDRVEYAATRFSQLSLDPTLPSEDVRSDGGSTVPRQSPRTLAAPIPTNAFAPPPNLSASDMHDSTDPPDAGRIARPVLAVTVPGADCVQACEERWAKCEGDCKTKACEACDKTYKTCVPTCFKDGEADAGKKRW